MTIIPYYIISEWLHVQMCQDHAKISSSNFFQKNCKSKNQSLTTAAEQARGQKHKGRKVSR